MITDPESIQRQYEPTRLSRYSHVKKRTYYSLEDYSWAYLKWANEKFAREHYWDDYCDMRDGVPQGTNRAIRKERTSKPWSH